MDRNALTEEEKKKALSTGTGQTAEGDQGGSTYDYDSSRAAPAAQKAWAALAQDRADPSGASKREQEREKTYEADKRAQKRKEAMARSLEDPILQERYNLLKRRTTQDLISPDHMDRWEESAREGAEEQKAALLSRARAMGLNASQMEALNQSLQETDATFERQIQKLRFENRESAKEEFENFTLALQTEGANQIHAEQSLALQAERDRSARSRAMWGSILGFVGGALGGTIGALVPGGGLAAAALGFGIGSGAGKPFGSVQ